MGSSETKIGQRDLVGQHVVDFDERVDIARLRRERLGNLQREMAHYDLSGLLLTDPINVRYATGTRWFQTLSMRWRMRQVIVPREGPPIFFGGTQADPPIASGDFPNKDFTLTEFWSTGPHYEEANRRWAGSIKAAVGELGISDEKIGVDRLDMQGYLFLTDENLKLVDAAEAITMARVTKTQDELALIRQAVAIADVGLAEVQKAIEPGVTENELFAVLSYTNLRYGGEYTDCKALVAGGNTNPWNIREASDRMVRPGDLVGMDTDMAGPMGYFADISRTYLCGDGPPNDEQKEAYTLAYEFIQESLPLFKPGVTFQELAESVPPIPIEYQANRYVVIAHGIGMEDEWPAVYFPGATWTGFGNYPGEFKENMVMSMEASFGREGGREQVKLEEQLIITANGPEVISKAPYDWRLVP